MIQSIIEFQFMRYALISGVLIGLIAPLIGVFLMVRRLSLISDALAHVTLSGVAAGLYLQNSFPAWFTFSPLYVGLSFSIGASFFVERLRRWFTHYQELAIPIVLSAGIGLGVVLISAADGFNVDVAGYLFGSILMINVNEMKGIILATGIVLAVVILFYKELFALSFDEENARIAGISERWINTLFMVAVAVVITASIRVVGILLVSGLITLPVAAGLQVAQSFRQVMMWSVIFAQTSVLCGLTAAYYLEWASGGTIVLVGVLLLLLVIGSKKGLGILKRGSLQ
ncbi:metal ABC transporter permease [Mechercharimyces sp. CAU 1602]|uniref:metal ABC transporter permease n=1 Tax=Mechercharimyces sp. CAU 1602 TaxID=2973933 RepID=UPI002163E929|nr:metal ABC transporter permease [Mechercharimyces sp. CAU 1602]MCS1352723.1 metal ABC transporter permease [Mechercharimyces sp. CAU 1602]